ncbi:hypothetical protein U9M48_011419 [Paspalum notatum var. saurae]|uniref:F-box domain-containing protein n=1 Tax=Paspalum notatum var. saurae TaxID=547442 RepID=A0AAQ3SVC8_PASNO
MEMILSAVLGEAITRSIDFFISKCSKPQAQDVEGTLHRALLRAQVIIDEAMGRQITNQAILLQLDMLRGAMHRCYYMLDTFRCQYSHEEDAEDQVSSKSFSLPKVNSLKDLCWSSNTNMCILGQLEKARDNLSSLVIDVEEVVVFLASYRRMYRQPYSMHLLLGNCMFGRQMEAEFAIKFLLHTQRHGPEELEVLPVVGPGKVGKSTLVAHVCKDERVRDHFSEILWLGEHDFTYDYIEECVLKLHNRVTVNSNKAERLLVIVELVGDLTEDAWNRLYSASKNCVPRGSKIIVTSRSDKIVRFGTTRALTLKHLPQEAFWYFFKTLVFGSADPETHPTLVRLAMETARMLNSSFNGALVMSSLLRDNFDARFWLRFLGFYKGLTQKHVSEFGARPSDLLNRNRPTRLWSMSGTSEDFVVHHQYQWSSAVEAPKIRLEDVMLGSVTPHRKFDMLLWKSRIPPFYSYRLAFFPNPPLSSARQHAAAALMDDLVEEFLLRIPPDDPARLLRAALVCKCWCRIISDPGFHRRFREFHRRTPPMLGFLSNFRTFSCFVPTTSFLPPRADAGICSYAATAIDARHGRVLLHAAPLYLNQNPMDSALVVWDPIRGDRTELPSLPRSYHPHTWNAAVLCASSLGGACDHLHCRRGHFLVVFMGFDVEQLGMFSYVYSSEAAAWSEPAYHGQHPGAAIGSVASALVGNALYFVLRDRKRVIEYDLGAREMSLIDLPADCSLGGNVLMATEEGGLGLANLVRNRLCLWSWEAGPDRDAGWVRSGAMDLRPLLPDEAPSASLHVAGVACDIAAIFVRTHVGIFTVDLKSCQVAKVYEDGGCFDNFPYIAFYTPGFSVKSLMGNGRTRRKSWLSLFVASGLSSHRPNTVTPSVLEPNIPYARFGHRWDPNIYLHFRENMDQKFTIGTINMEKEPRRSNILACAWTRTILLSSYIMDPSNEAYWYFFRTLAFGSTDPKQHPRLASVAMEISRMLSGRALIAANITASLLRDNSHQHLVQGSGMDMLLSTVLGEAIGRSIDFFISKCSKKQEQDVEGRLGSVLIRAQVIIDEAKGRQITNQAMLLQLEMLRGAMHRGYYMLDTFRCQYFHDKEDAEDQAVSQSLSLCKLDSMKYLRSFHRRTQLFTQLQEMLDSLNSMILDANEMIIFLKSYRQMCRQPYSMHLVLANCMFDRQMETELVINFLLHTKLHHHAEELEVLPIVGPRRVGKRTLVAHVCNDERVRDHFSEIVFLTDDDFRDDTISVLGQGCAMEQQICTTKKDVRLLVVVEVAGDVNADSWNKLCSAFRQPASNGNRVIITSRSDKIAKLGTTGVITLKYPSNEAYWYFFRTLAFGSTDPKQHPRLASVAMEISRMLSGRALIAANITASLLRDNFNINFWCKVLAFMRGIIQKHIANFGENPCDLLNQNRPTHLGRMSIASESFMVYDQCHRSSQETVPNITFADVFYGSIKPHEKFEVLAWRSRIPPYYNYIYTLEKQICTSKKDGRLLVVVEVAGDVTADSWNKLCSAIKHSASNGARIVITSRSDRITRLGTTGAITLKYLTDEAYWYFFRTQTFGSTDPKQHPRLASVAMEIAGLLSSRAFIAANIIASLLRDNFDINFWCKVLAFMRGLIQKHIANFGENPCDLLNQNRPTHLGRMSIASEGFLVYAQCHHSSQETVPNLTFADVFCGSIKAHGKFEVLAWRSQIPPYYNYVYTSSEGFIAANVTASLLKDNFDINFWCKVLKFLRGLIQNHIANFGDNPCDVLNQNRPTHLGRMSIASEGFMVYDQCHLSTQETVPDITFADVCYGSIKPHGKFDMILSAVLGEAITRSIDFFISKCSKPQAQDVEGTLRRALLRAQVIIDKAMGRQITNQAILLQLDMLRGAMHRCYYMLDTFRCQYSHDEDAEDQVSSKSFSLPKVNSLKDLCWSSNTNMCILGQLEKARDNLSSLVIDVEEVVVFLASYRRMYRQPYSMHLLLGNCMFGRQMEAEFAIKFLLHTQHHGPKELEVLPVVGPGKVGKSTLVAHVCKDERVRDHFSEILWLGEHDFTYDYIEECVLKLHNRATVNSNKAERLLVIVELVGDLTEDAWNRLYSASKNCVPRGSKIIVTSRSDKIVRFGTTRALTLKHLPQEAFWYFFKTLVFGSADPETHPTLVRLAMETARMLNSSFNGALVMSSLLRDNFDARFWLRFLGFYKGLTQKHVSEFGARPSDLLNRNRPTRLWSMSGTSEDFVVHHQYQWSSAVEAPKIRLEDVMLGSVTPHRKFDMLLWKSRIPPFYSYRLAFFPNPPLSSARQHAAAALMDDLVEEFLLRIPPDDPARLLRAALVCKCWCRIISDPGFHRRFREFHRRTPPMLGFLSNFRTFSCFVPTTSFLPPRADAGICSYAATAIDARHGRVLLHAAPLYLNQNPMDSALVVWDPIRGDRTELPSLPRSYHPHTWNAAVLCASSLGGACDHLHCRRGHFLVVFMGFDVEQLGMFSYVYSSEAAAWSEPAYHGQHPGAAIGSVASALVGNALYFVLRDRKRVIEYDLGAREMSLIDLPADCSLGGNVLMATEEGGLGLANLVRNRLCLWSWEAGPDRDAGWVRSGAMDLRPLLPDEAPSASLHVAGVACDIAAIFVRTHVGIFTVDLKSCQVAKVYEDGGCFDNFPYIAFYTPELKVASTEGQRMGTSNA